jgi:hypothetical protein
MPWPEAPWQPAHAGAFTPLMPPRQSFSPRCTSALSRAMPSTGFCIE